MVFCFVQNFFFGQHKSSNIYFFCRARREIFFQNLTLGYMTKTLNQTIFFSFTKIRIFFSTTLGIRIFFLEKNHNPPSPFKLNGRSLKCLFFIHLQLSIIRCIDQPISNYVFTWRKPCVCVYFLYLRNVMSEQWWRNL